MPFGAMASSRVRTTESLPGSQPAEMMDTVPCALATSFSAWRRAGTSVWMSKLSTVWMPMARIFLACSSTLRVGVQRMATSTSFSSSISFTTG